MDIPYFIEIRGCINCNASKGLKEKTGHDYGFDHELMARCILLGCQDYSVSLATPFIDPEEIVRFAKERKQVEDMKKAKQYCLKIKERFGKFYNELGISLDDIINKLK